MTDSHEAPRIEETDRAGATSRCAWNEAHGITPVSIKRQIGKVLGSVFEQDYVTVEAGTGDAAQLVGKDLKAGDRRSGEAHARRGGRSGVRGGGAAARRDPPAGGRRARHSFAAAKRRRPPAVQRGSRRVAVEPTSARPPRPRAAPAAAPAPEPGRLPYGDAWLGPRARAYLRLLDHRLARLRALLRADELALVATAALVGAAAGVAVAVMSRATQLVHELLFAIARGRASRPAPASALARPPVPVVGGLLLGGVMVASGRYRSRAGGRPDRGQRALWRPHVAARQPGRRARDADLERRRRLGRARGRLHPGRLGHRLRLGDAIRLRRNDLRILVGCGAAGAIAAAFDAR